MRKFIYFFTLSLSLLGCSTSDDIQEYRAALEQPSSHISKVDALSIANKVIKKSPTTRNSQEAPLFEYVLNDNKIATRHSALPDTLAYVINYPNDEGFVIVASDRRVYPVLGFSDKGSFSFNNDIAKVNFIDRIESYIGNADATTYNEVQDSDFDGCYAVEPIVKTSLGQHSPWNKYVVEEHPNCPTGCVAVATALVLSHSTTELNYHGSTFYFKSIIEAINKQMSSEDTDITDLYDDWDKIEQPTYTFEQAVDSMAKLMYYIGKDVNMEYDRINGSRANSLKAYYLCLGIASNVNSEFSPFDINDVSWLLKNNNIIYLSGSSHAWVADGCYFCVSGKDGNDSGISVGGSYQNEEILSTYIHCDWGWDGACNGYYSGRVFETFNGDFTPAQYFSLKRDHKKNNFTVKW